MLNTAFDFMSNDFFETSPNSDTNKRITKESCHPIILNWEINEEGSLYCFRRDANIIKMVIPFAAVTLFSKKMSTRA